ncbi:hypothetical protein ACLMJK_002784 [Lecanora helva]
MHDELQALKMDRLLIMQGMNINRSIGGETMLMDLSASASPGRLQQLIDFGADLEIRNAWGRTAVMYSIGDPTFRNFQLLAFAGAQLDVQDMCGNTVLHLAIMVSRPRFDLDRLIQTLSSRDSIARILEMKNGDGYSAFDLLKLRNSLRWEGYCKRRHRDFYDLERSIFFNSDWVMRVKRTREHDKKEAPIRKFEDFFHKVQDLQGIPKEEQYPPLGDYLSGDDEDDAVPRAWPL